MVHPNYADVYFSLGTLYADEMKDQPKSVEAFTRYLELGGNHARARAAIAQSTPTPAAPAKRVAGCGETMLAHERVCDRPTCMGTAEYPPQDAQKGRQQGRSERRSEGVPLWYVEGLSDAERKRGKERVSARQGWAGERAAFFSILR